jgi:hypothetical protein
MPNENDDDEPDLSRNHIRMFMHCANCARQKPPNKSPQDWNRTETGVTPWGIQVFCLRCKLNVAHMTPEALEAMVAQASGRRH